MQKTTWLTSLKDFVLRVRAAASGAEHLEQPVSYIRTFFFLGLAHWDLGQQEEARQHFERFLGFWVEGSIDAAALAIARTRAGSAEVG